jgi:uncharacterized membrane protein
MEAERMKAVTNKTSMLKSLIWRIMGVIVLGAVTFFYTRNWFITTSITLVHHAFFLLVFYLHERLWTRLKKPTGRLRNIIKSVIYEIFLGMGFGGLIVFLFTNSFPSVTHITGTYTCIKLVMYFFYDKLWPELRS